LVERGRARVKADCFVEIRDGVDVVADQTPDPTTEQEDVSVVRVKADRFAVVSDGALMIILQAIGGATNGMERAQDIVVETPRIDRTCAPPIAASPDALVQATKSFADAGINDKTFTAATPTADFTVAATRMSGIDVAAKYPALPKSVPPKMIPTDHNTSFRCISTFRPSMGSNPLVA